MNISCGTCTVEESVWAVVQGEQTPTGKPKKKRILVRVPKEYVGTEEAAEQAGWVLGEFGYQCPPCVQTAEVALAGVEEDATPGDNESATIHHALNQLTSHTVLESERVNREQYATVAEELMRFLASGLNFTLWQCQDDSFVAQVVEDDLTGKGSSSLNALMDLAIQKFPRIISGGEYPASKLEETLAE